MKARIVIALVIVIAFVVSGLVRAQSGGDYDLTWYTVDNGGVSFRMDNKYQLGGTIGQPDAGMLNGGNYTLAGGFWWDGAASKSLEPFIYLPFVLKNSP
jgi:hypothetical protein